MTDTHEKIVPKQIYDHKITRELIVKGEDEPEQMTWHEAMKKFEHGGTDPDWRLPTKSELDFIYENKDLIGGFTNNRYWTSAEFISTAAWSQDSINAWSQDFSDRGHGSSNKTVTLDVRCVRR